MCPTAGQKCTALGSSLLLLLFSSPLLSAIDPSKRDAAFIGYSEKKACRDTNGACEDWAKKGECESNPAFMKEGCPVSCKLCEPPELHVEDYLGEMLVLETSMGSIRIKMLFDNAPKTSALIMDLAHQPACEGCNFYRNEEDPKVGMGPPYGLVQGSLAGLLHNPPHESALKIPASYGHACMIGSSTDFYIALMNHNGWEGGHTVWGEVMNMDVLEEISSKSPWHNFTHPDFGTVMRMMESPLKFQPKFEALQEHEL